MLVFLDTEFTDSLDCDLISLGMVHEDGQHELYLERSDYRDDWCNSFVRAAVQPQLGAAGPAVTKNQRAARLAAWFAELPSPVTVACDSFTDWELLLDALGDERPANLGSYLDLRPAAASPVFSRAVVRYHEDHGPWHHALHDARAIRQGWKALQDE
jgi:hypothetical protein